VVPVKRALSAVRIARARIARLPIALVLLVWPLSACNPRPQERAAGGSSTPSAAVLKPAQEPARSEPPALPATPQVSADNQQAVRSQPAGTAPAGAAAQDPGSASLIRRATHITVLRVLAIDNTGTRTGSGTQTASRQLSVELVEVLKGELTARAGARASVSIAQTALSGRRVFAVPGVWSALEVAAGREYVVFAQHSGASELAAVIAEPATIGVLPSEDARADVRAAMTVERGQRSLVALLQDASARAARDTLANYLAERIAQQLMFADREGFEHAMRLVEARDLPERSRLILIEAIALRARAPEAPEPFVARTALAIFRLLAATHAAALHDSLLANDLPPLLQHPVHLKPAAVFASSAADRKAASTALDAYRGPSDVQPIRAWLNAE
jgi:hypothetical protein